MKPIPFVSPQSIASLLSSLDPSVGAEARRLQVGLAGRPATVAAVGHFLEDLSRATNDPAIGLEIGLALRFEDMPLGRLVARSPTLGAALAAAGRAQARYCGGQQVRIERHGERALLFHTHAHALQHGRRQANDFALLVLYDLIRSAAGADWRPDELYLEGAPPAHAERLAAPSSGATHFDAEADCIVLPAHLLALPLPRRDAAPRAASEALPELDFVESIRHAIRFHLDRGDLELHRIAEDAGASPRSTQRALNDLGLAFAQLVDEARFERAIDLLSDPKMRVIEVSIALGYNDPANFTRAFRRWSGMSPRAFRRARSRTEAAPRPLGAAPYRAAGSSDAPGAK